MIKLNVLLIIIISTNFILAQETNNKLDNLKGEVTRITVETTEGEVEITGDEAKQMLSKMKKKSKSNFVFLNEDGETKEITVDVEVEETGGEKVVIIKKNIDGIETIEEYKGEAAEKHILKMKDGHGMKFISEDGDVHVIVKDGDEDLVWVSENDENMTKKEVKVEVVDGVKKVTVTTTEDGEETTKVYEGDEADKILQDMDHGSEQVFISKDGQKTVIKKKVIIEEEHEEEEHAE